MLLASGASSAGPTASRDPARMIYYRLLAGTSSSLDRIATIVNPQVFEVEAQASR